MTSKPARTWWPYLLIAGMVFAFFWDSFLAGKALVMRDTFSYFLPWRLFGRQAFQAGTLPLWNPYSNCGQPFIAEPQTAFFYPPNLLFYILPPVFALKLWLALHVSIGGASMYALARQWRLSIASSLIAAVGFAFGTYMIGGLEFQSLTGTVVWTPLVLLLMGRLLESGRGISAGGFKPAAVRMIPPTLWLGLVVATQFLAGHQQVFLYSSLICAIYLAVIWLGRFEMKPFLMSCLALAIAAVFALGLSMTQLLETLHAVPLSIRGAGFDPKLDMGSLHPRLLMSWIMPFMAGTPSHFSQWWGYPKLTIFEFWVGTAYVGLPPLVLATLSLAWFARPHARRNLRAILIVLLVVAGIGLVMSMGKYTPVYMWCYDHLPAINKFRWPSKFLQLVAFSLPLLGALGLQGIIERGEKTERRIRAAILAAWVLIWVAIALAWLAARHSPGFFSWLTGGAFVYNPRFPGMLASISGDLGKAVLFLGVTLLAIIACTLERAPARRKRAGVIALPVLAFVNLFVIGRQVQPIMSDSVYKSSVLYSSRLQNDPDPGRFISDQYDNPYDLYGIREPQYYTFVKDTGAGELWLPLHVFRAYGVGVIQLGDYIRFKDQLWMMPESDPMWSRVANVMNIRDKVLVPTLIDVLTGAAPATIQFGKNRDALPRAMVAYAWAVKNTDAETTASLLSPGFDIYRSIVVDRVPDGWPAQQELAPNSPHDPITEITKAGVDEIKYGWNRVDLKVRNAARAFLFLNDTYYPGWRATVDGKEVQISRADMVFRAVPLETAGVHTVSFVYWPRRVWIGLVTNIVTVLIMCALGFMAWNIRQRRAMV